MHKKIWLSKIYLVTINWECFYLIKNGKDLIFFFLPSFISAINRGGSGRKNRLTVTWVDAPENESELAGVVERVLSSELWGVRSEYLVIPLVIPNSCEGSVLCAPFSPQNFLSAELGFSAPWGWRRDTCDTRYLWYSAAKNRIYFSFLAPHPFLNIIVSLQT